MEAAYCTVDSLIASEAASCTPHSLIAKEAAPCTVYSLIASEAASCTPHSLIANEAAYCTVDSLIASEAASCTPHSLIANEAAYCTVDSLIASEAASCTPHSLIANEAAYCTVDSLIASEAASCTPHSLIANEAAYCTVDSLIASEAASCTPHSLIANEAAPCTVDSLIANEAASCTPHSLIANEAAYCTVHSLIANEAAYCTVHSLIANEAAYCTVDSLIPNEAASCTVDSLIANEAAFCTAGTVRVFRYQGRTAPEMMSHQWVPTASMHLSPIQRAEKAVNRTDGSTHSGSGNNVGNFPGPLGVMLAALPPGNNFQAIRNGLSKTSPAKKKHPFSGTQAFDTSYTKQVSSELSKPQQHNPPRKSASLFNLSSKSGLMSHMTKTDTQSKIFTKKNCSTGQMAIAINEHEVHLGPLSDSLQGFGVVPFPSRISPGLLNTEEVSQPVQPVLKSGLMSHMTKTDTQSKIFTKKNCSTGQMAIAINEHEVHLGPLSDSLQGFGVVPFPSRISPHLVKFKLKRAVSWIFGGNSEKVDMAENDANEEAKIEKASNLPIFLCGERSGKAASSKAEGTATRSAANPM
eukprot:gene16593-22831_t